MPFLKSMLGLFFIATLAQSAHAQGAGAVHTVGAMRDMGENQFKTQVWLDTLAPKEHLYGMGPYDRMKGEIMVYDGKPFYASTFGEGKAKVGQSWDIRSPFFVYAHVPEWQGYALTGDVKGLTELQDMVAQMAQRHGFDTKEPFPFLIKGTFPSLTTHIVTPRSADVEGYRADIKQQEFSFENAKGTLLGFYSEKHQGVFTSSNSYVHVHYLSNDQTYMGHLDNIQTGATSLTLYLPAWPTNGKTGMRVNDTDFSKGRMGHIQEVEVQHLVRFHGHLCDGLIVGHLALGEALAQLYPSGIIDRTNTRIVSRPSPCLTDAAIYLTGGRYQFNTFYVSEDIEGLFVVQRMDTGKTVVVNMKEDVKPEAIDRLGAQAVKGTLAPCALDGLKALEDAFSEKLLQTDPKTMFTVTERTNFQWKPVLKNDFVKTDILNKDAPKCVD